MSDPLPSLPPPPPAVTASAPALPSPPPTEGSAADACRNCGHPLAGAPYCARCGQKQLHPHDLGLAHAWHHVLHELTHVDGKIFTTLRLLFTRPGQLTLDFVEGKRARHVHPIRLFLVIGFFFYLAAPNNPNTNFGAILSRSLGPDTHETLAARAAPAGLTRDQWVARAIDRTNAVYKPVNITTTILAGVGFWVLFRRRRPYLAENLVMALHLASFNMATFVVLGASSAWLFGPESLASRAAGLVIAALAFANFLVATRRVYAGHWLMLVLKFILIEALKALVLFGTLAAVFYRALAAP